MLQTQWLEIHKQAGTRAGNHQRHTRTTDVSPPTQAHNATRATNVTPPARLLYVHLTNTTMPVGHISLNQHNTHTSHGTLCQQATSHEHGSTAPTVGATGTRAAHTQVKPRGRGNPSAPVSKPRNSSAGALRPRWAGTNKTNGI